MSSLNKNILINTLWSVFGQVGTLGIGLIVNIIIARILTPYQFGQIGIIMFFIVIANVFVESGLGGALVRKKEVTKEEYSTVFTFNMVVSIVCYLLLFFFSEAIANYYQDHALQKILIVSGLVLIINAFQIVPNIDMMRKMQYKNIVKYRFIAVLISAIISVFFAFNGIGVWALVIMQLLSAFLTTVLFWINQGVFFEFKFNKDSFKELYGFGVNTTLASLLNTVFENIYQLILGRFFSINQVGFFYQAKKLQEIPVGILNMTTQSVIFSSLSKLQDDKKVFVETYNRIVLLLTIVVGAITTFTYLYSKDIIVFLYGVKWVESVFYMKVLCIASFFYMQEMFNRVLFKVLNDTKKILYLELIKKAIQSVTIVIGILKMDLELMLYGFVFTSIVSYLINFYYSRKLIGGAAFFELMVVVKVFFSGALVIFGIQALKEYFLPEKYFFIITLPVFIGAYLLCLEILKVIQLKKELIGLINMVRNK